MDTKYKLLNANKSDKYGIKQADIRFVIDSGFADVQISIDILQVSFVLDYECFRNGDKSGFSQIVLKIIKAMKM